MVYFKKTFIALVLLLGTFASTAWAFQPFQVNNIRVIGLKRVSEAAVRNDLSIQPGETLSETRSSEVIRTLYKTGFFKSVELERDGNTLIVRVVERPSVSKLTLNGVKEKDKVLKVLRDAGLAESLMYDPTVLARAQKALEIYYLKKVESQRMGFKACTSFSSATTQLPSIATFPKQYCSPSVM